MTRRVAPSPAAASPAAVWTAMSLVYVIWGSTYLAIAITVETAPPMVSMGIRFLAAALLLGGYLVVRRGPHVLRVAPRELGGAALVGVLLLFGGMSGLSYAERHVDSGLAALIVAGVPVWVVLLRLTVKDRARPLTWAGVVVGLAGLVVLLRPQPGAEADLGWSLLIMAGSAAWAVGSFLQPRLPTPDDPLVLTLYQMCAGGIALLVTGSALGERLDPTALSVSSTVAWVYLVVVGSLVAYVAYVWVLGHASLSLVSTYAYVNPVVAVVLGVLVRGEQISAAMVVGGAIVVVGVGLVVTAERPTRSARVRGPADHEGATRVRERRRR